MILIFWIYGGNAIFAIFHPPVSRTMTSENAFWAKIKITKNAIFGHFEVRLLVNAATSPIILLTLLCNRLLGMFSSFPNLPTFPPQKVDAFWKWPIFALPKSYLCVLGPTRGQKCPKSHFSQRVWKFKSFPFECRIDHRNRPKTQFFTSSQSWAIFGPYFWLTKKILDVSPGNL